MQQLMEVKNQVYDNYLFAATDETITVYKGMWGVLRGSVQKCEKYGSVTELGVYGRQNSTQRFKTIWINKQKIICVLTLLEIRNNCIVIRTFGWITIIGSCTTLAQVDENVYAIEFKELFVSLNRCRMNSVLGAAILTPSW